MSTNRELNVLSKPAKASYILSKSTTFSTRSNVDTFSLFLNPLFSSIWMTLNMSPSHGTSHAYQTNHSVAASVQATRTFDLTIELGGTSHAFLNLNREEQKNLEPYFKSKKIRIRNDLNDNSEDLLKKALADESDSELDEPSSDDEGDRPAADDEDSEEDEDFEEDSDDEDVAEEYDENAKGSDSDGDAGSGGGGDDDDMDVDEDDEEDEEERPAKKAKTKK